MWNGRIQHQDVRSARETHRDKTSIQKLTQMPCIFHTLALAATTTEIISCSSWDLVIHHHVYFNQIMTSKGNLETAAEPYLGPALDWGPTQLWPTAICPLLSVPVQKKTIYLSAQGVTVQPIPQKARSDTFHTWSFPTGKNEPQEAVKISL